MHGALQRYCLDHDIDQDLSSAYFHEQQSMIERVHQFLQSKIRAMLHHAKFEKQYWTLALDYATLLCNWSPSYAQGMNGCSPYELLFHKKPDYTMLRVWGCDAYAHIDVDTREKGKLGPRAKKHIFVGLDPGNKAFRLIDPDAFGDTITRGMVKFVEDSFTAAKGLQLDEELSPLDSIFNNTIAPGVLYTSDDMLPAGTNFLHLSSFCNAEDLETYACVEFIHDGLNEPMWLEVPRAPKFLSEDLQNKLYKHIMSSIDSLTLNPDYPLFGKCEFADEPNDDPIETVLVGIDHSPTSEFDFTIMYHEPISDDNNLVLDVKHAQVKMIEPQHNLTALSASSSSPSGITYFKHKGDKVVTIPKDYSDIKNMPDAADWYASVEREMNGINEHQGLTYVHEPPAGYEKISSILHFHPKVDIEGYWRTDKSRLCPHGFKQWDSFKEIFAGTPQLAMLKVLCAFGLMMQILPQMFDIRQAFQHGEMDFKLCIELPKGYSVNGCRYAIMEKALQGCKQGANRWNAAFHEFLFSLDPSITKGTKEPNLYFTWSTDTKYLMAKHVDDCFGLSSPTSYWNGIADAMEEKWGVSNRGPMISVLGNKLHWLTSDTGALTGVVITQTRNIEELETLFQVTKHTRPVKIPLDTKTILDVRALPTKCTANNSLGYLSLLGKLLWIARNCRPDIMFAVKFMSRYTACYQELHMRALLRISRYLVWRPKPGA